MGERRWTEEQLSAINTLDKTLLVSAAAGSGKTATLTERIIRSLTDEKNPVDIDSLLVVTFTNAAARELRAKIAKALTEAVEAKTEKKEKPKRPGGTKNLEKELNANERAVAKAEERMAELDRAIEESAADYVKLQELYEQKEALEMELLELYEAWERISAQLEEARG